MQKINGVTLFYLFASNKIGEALDKNTEKNKSSVGKSLGSSRFEEETRIYLQRSPAFLIVFNQIFHLINHIQCFPTFTAGY